MQFSSRSVEKLVDELTHLPGIGRKTAQRLAFYLLKTPKEEALALAEAIRVHLDQTGKKGIKIWGYRNVWFRFDPSEANLFVPTTMSMFSTMHDAFMNSFITQKDASFPSYEHDGPFSQLAQSIQVDQYRQIKTCLGREWFHNHASALIRGTRGLVFLKEMSPDVFFTSCRELRKSVENL